MSSLSTSLKNSYQRWLCPYEEYLRIAKPGVHQQLEQEYGGPLTPSPGQTPVKRSHLNSPTSTKDNSPARQASDALQNGLKREADRDTPMVDAPPAPTSAGSGFTAVNASAGGFKAVNSGFTSVNRGSHDGAKSSTPDPKRFDSPSTRHDTPDDQSGLGAAAHLKRNFSRETSSDTPKKEQEDEDDGEGSNRRSKRLRRGMLYCGRAMLDTFNHANNCHRKYPYCCWLPHDSVSPNRATYSP